MKPKVDELSWRVILEEVTKKIESAFGLQLVLDSDVVDEFCIRTNITLANYGLNVPNEAKIAGHVSFWIRRLKPISHHEQSERKYLAINEMVGLYVGMAICRRFSNSRFKYPSKRVMLDWIASLRVNSHSPQGTALSFEVLTQV